MFNKTSRGRRRRDALAEQLNLLTDVLWVHSGGESLCVFIREFADRLTDLFLCGLTARVCRW